MGTKRTWVVAAVLLAAVGRGSEVRAQDAKPKDAPTQGKKDLLRNALEGADQDGSETAEQRVARAKLLADSEHDYEKALALASGVAHEEKNAPDLRAQALVIAARCLTHLGKADEARRQLRVAAQLNGPAADEAKRLLDAGLTDQQLELRIAKAIEELFGVQNSDIDIVDRLKKSRAAEDLIWLGAPAVPRLVKVLGDGDRLANVTGATYLLARIDTEEAASAVKEAVKRTDPLYRRAILRGIVDKNNAGGLVDWRIVRCRAAVLTMLGDPDSRVKEWLLDDAGRAAQLAEILPLTRDPDDAVRIAAWNALNNWITEPRGSVGEDLVSALRRCLKEDHDPVRLAAISLFNNNNYALLGLASARSLFVESLLDPVLTAPGQNWTQSWDVMRNGPSTNSNIDVPVPIDLMARVGNALGPYAHYEGLNQRLDGDQRHSAWAGTLNKSSLAVARPGGRVGWPVEDREKVWPLLRLGVGPWINGWVIDNARAEDLPAIAENSVACGDVSVVKSVIERLVAHADSKRGTVEWRWSELPREMRSTVAKSLLQLFDADVATMDTAHPFQDVRLSTTTNLLIKLGTVDADGAVVRVLRKAPEVGFVVQLLDRGDPPLELARVAELVTIPLPADMSSMRNKALGRLAAGHVDAFSDVLARCYELGLEVRGDTKLGSLPGGIVWMVSTPSDASRLPPSDWVARWAPAYSEAELRVAFEACVKVNSPTFWPDVRTALSLLPQDGPFDPVGKMLLEVAARHLAGATATSITEPMREDLIKLLLRRRAPGWEGLALAYLAHPDHASSVLNNLPAITPEMLARVAPSGDSAAKGSRNTTDTIREKLVDRMPGERDESIRARIPDYLKDPVGRVRAAALKATLSAFPDRALDLILPLAHDENSGVRFALAESLGAVFDRRAIPVLVELLQDPSEGVRGVAKKSLDSLQYVFEQKEKWKRVLEGAGLDSTNAAEALVKQAAAGQPKATRIIAIESLGTLGVAETLPVLIQFMGDGDAEIAAAATEAVTRINRQSKTGKDAKPPSDH